MDAFWLVVYPAVAGLAILQATLIVVQTWEHRRYARRRLGEVPHAKPSGRALLVIPCRGSEVGLEEHLSTLLNQDYGDYQVRFVVESDDDPACEPIRRVMAAHPAVRAELIVAGQAALEGQKVHNLRAATADVPPEVKYLAFADSDARLRPHWLRVLLGQLHRPEVGATTGYRWFIPLRPSLADHLVYSINSSTAVWLAAKVHHMVWGGSWAMRRELFESVGLRQAWEGTLSDDLVAARQLSQSGRRVIFEPGCIVESPSRMTFAEMFRFVRRQYLIGRLYAPAWWAFAVAALTFANVALLLNVAALAAALLTGTPPVWLAAGMLAGLLAVHVFRGRLRRDLALLYFPDRAHAMQTALRWDTWGAPLVGLFNWLAMLAAAFGQHVAWRGIHYRLRPGGRVRALWRDEESCSDADRASQERRQPPSATESTTREKGDSPHLPERPAGCCTQMGTVPFFPKKAG